MVGMIYVTQDGSNPIGIATNHIVFVKSIVGSLGAHIRLDTDGNIAVTESREEVTYLMLVAGDNAIAFSEANENLRATIEAFGKKNGVERESVVNMESV